MSAADKYADKYADWRPTPEHKPQSITDLQWRIACAAARNLFKHRGNNTRIQITEAELAGCVAGVLSACDKLRSEGKI